MKNHYQLEYNRRFPRPQIYVKSPGRVNIIGEHIDYNHGVVLPFTIKQSIHLIIGTNTKNLLRVHSLDLNEYKEYSLDKLTFMDEGWVRYFVNSIVALDVNISKGIDVIFGGDLPQGAGLSSSSSLTCGFLAGLNACFSLNLSKDQLINLASQAENGIGLQGGMMDQTAVVKGKNDHAVKIDFLDFSTEEIPLPGKPFTFYIFNSGQKHNLVETGYNQRRATCEKGLKQIQSSNSQVQNFRDVREGDLLNISDSVTRKRCRHVIEENERVLESIEILKSGKFEKLGSLINASHESLSKLYESSTPEIDILVQKSRSLTNHIGGRIMGGGFGGSTINLFNGPILEQEVVKLKKTYYEETGYKLDIIKAESGEGLTVEIL